MNSKTDKGTIFYNADYIVIEYIDIIKSPYLLLLHVIRGNDRLKSILKLEEVELLDDAGLYEWYINRKHQNFFIDLLRHPDEVEESKMDELLEELMNSSPEFYTKATPLVIIDLLITVSRQPISKGVIIYHPHKNDFAKNDLEQLVGGDYIFMDDFDEVLKKAGYNSTYFLSDINKIYKMQEKECLRCSSITLPVEYRYNKKNMEDFSVDFEELYQKDPFKLTFFRACTEEIEIEPSDEIKQKMKENNEEVENINLFDMMKELEEEFNNYEEDDEGGFDDDGI